jgi:methyl coenzyme M reductase subunit D
MREIRNAYKILVGKYIRKKPLGRPGRRGEDIIKMDHREIGWEDVD